MAYVQNIDSPCITAYLGIVLILAYVHRDRRLLAEGLLGSPVGWLCAHDAVQGLPGILVR